MEEPDRSFFYTARSFGINPIVLSFAEVPLFDWNGRIAYITAKAEKERLKIYAYDLLWAAVKNNYRDLPMPSEIANNRKRTDTRTAKQIIEDLVKDLDGQELKAEKW